MSDTFNSQVLEILGQHELCVISTVTADAKPEAAIVAFSQSDDLKLLIGTSNKTRKYANLQQNPHVAVAIGDARSEVQYEGTVSQLEKSELQAHLQTHFEKLPGTAIYLEDPTQVWLLVTPTWIRLTIHSDQNLVEERTFA